MVRSKIKLHRNFSIKLSIIYTLFLLLWLIIAEVLDIIPPEGLLSAGLLQIIFASAFIVIVFSLNYIFIFRGVLKVRNLENRLYQNEEMYKYVINNTTLGLWTYNLETGQCILPPKWKEYLGYADGEIQSDASSWMNIIHPEDIQQLRHIYDSYRNKSLDVFQSEYRIKKKNGEWIWIIAHGAGIWTSKGELIKLLVTHMDITQRKEAEAKLQLMIKENENLLKRAIENEKIKSEFFCNISHEFRTPLNIILGVVQLFESNRKYLSDGSQSNNYIRILKQNCYRVLRLINNILEINKIDARYSELNLKNHNIIGLVEDIALSVTEFINNRGMSITFDTDMEERIIACDEYKIERIILNLLSNSIKYSKTDTQIFVNITNEKDFVNITVRDTGIGIQRDKIHTIFDRFTQVDSSLTRKCEGSGIGLSIVKSYVEMHGGEIWVESEYGLGTEFTIKLPAKVLNNNRLEMHEETSSSIIERVNIEFSDIYSS